jgi:hypothetical protein
MKVRLAMQDSLERDFKFSDKSYEPAEFWQDGTVPLPMKQ